MDCRGPEADAAAHVLSAPYQGGIEGNRYSGFGRTILKSGAEYCGMFAHGRRHGKGTMVWADGLKYVGEWYENAATGSGYLEWPNGATYWGQVKHGRRHGRGVHCHKGARFLGEWEGGLRHGFGVQMSDEGTYTGEWVRGKRHGWGSMDFASLNNYSGEWRDDKMEGIGSMLWVSLKANHNVPLNKIRMASNKDLLSKARQHLANVGSTAPGPLGPFTPAVVASTDILERYIGQWQDNQPHGEGEYQLMFHSSGARDIPFESVNYYKGNFRNGLREGKGVQHFADGTSFEGTWRANLKHGRGTIHHPDGSCTEITLDHDVPAEGENAPFRGNTDACVAATTHITDLLEPIVEGEEPVIPTPHEASLLLGNSAPTPALGDTPNDQPNEPATAAERNSLTMKNLSNVAARYTHILRHLFNVYSTMKNDLHLEDAIARLNVESQVPTPEFVHRLPTMTTANNSTRPKPQASSTTSSKLTVSSTGIQPQQQSTSHPQPMTLKDVAPGTAPLDRNAQLTASMRDVVTSLAMAEGQAALQAFRTAGSEFTASSMKLDLGSPMVKVSECDLSPLFGDRATTTTVDSSSEAASPTSPTPGINISTVSKTPDGRSSSSAAGRKRAASPLVDSAPQRLEDLLPSTGFSSTSVRSRNARNPEISFTMLMALLNDAQVIDSSFSGAQVKEALAPLMLRRETSALGSALHHCGSLSFATFVEGLIRIADFKFRLSYPFFAADAIHKVNLVTRFQYLVEEFLIPVAHALRDLDHCSEFTKLGVDRFIPQVNENVTIEEIRKNSIKVLRDKSRLAKREKGEDGRLDGTISSMGATQRVSSAQRSQSGAAPTLVVEDETFANTLTDRPASRQRLSAGGGTASRTGNTSSADTDRPSTANTDLFEVMDLPHGPPAETITAAVIEKSSVAVSSVVRKDKSYGMEIWRVKVTAKHAAGQGVKRRVHGVVVFTDHNSHRTLAGLIPHALLQRYDERYLNSERAGGLASIMNTTMSFGASCAQPPALGGPSMDGLSVVSPLAASNMSLPPSSPKTPQAILRTLPLSDVPAPAHNVARFAPVAQIAHRHLANILEFYDKCQGQLGNVLDLMAQQGLINLPKENPLPKWSSLVEKRSSEEKGRSVFANDEQNVNNAPKVSDQVAFATAASGRLYSLYESSNSIVKETNAQAAELNSILVDAAVSVRGMPKGATSKSSEKVDSKKHHDKKSGDSAKAAANQQPTETTPAAVKRTLAVVPPPKHVKELNKLATKYAQLGKEERSVRGRNLSPRTSGSGSGKGGADWETVLKELTFRLFQAEIGTEECTAISIVDDGSAQPMYDPQMLRAFLRKCPEVASALQIRAAQEDHRRNRRETFRNLRQPHGKSLWFASSGPTQLTLDEFVVSLVELSRLITLPQADVTKSGRTSGALSMLPTAELQLHQRFDRLCTHAIPLLMKRKLTVSSLSRQPTAPIADANKQQEKSGIRKPKMRRNSDRRPSASILSLVPVRSPSEATVGGTEHQADNQSNTLTSLMNHALSKIDEIQKEAEGLQVLSYWESQPPIRVEKAYPKLKRRTPLEDPKKKKKK